MSIASTRNTWQDSDDQHSEGTLARIIEDETAKLPSDLFLWLAAGSMACSLGLKLSGRVHDSLFVGQWAPTFLILGLYNKLVKVAGSDRADQAESSDNLPKRQLVVPEI